MDKILFLDIDGVLLPYRAYYLPNQTKGLVTVFDPTIVGMINAICEKFGTKLVIHSSWLRSVAIAADACEPKVTSIKEHMINQGLKAEYFHEDAECFYRFSGTRWTAINDWLDDHDGDVSAYWILEDEPVPYGWYTLDAYPFGKVIQTDPWEGFGYKDFVQIRKDLKDLESPSLADAVGERAF